MVECLWIVCMCVIRLFIVDEEVRVFGEGFMRKLCVQEMRCVCVCVCSHVEQI